MRTQPGLICLVVITVIFLLSTIVPEADTFRPVVRGKRGAVAAGHPLSAEAGMRLLQQGGNAVDAGCAAMLAASVIEFSHFSFGGEVPIIIKTANGAPVVINGQGIAPRLATASSSLSKLRKKIRPQGLFIAARPNTFRSLTVARCRGRFLRRAYCPRQCPACSMRQSPRLIASAQRRWQKLCSRRLNSPMGFRLMNCA